MEFHPESKAANKGALPLIEDFVSRDQRIFLSIGNHLSLIALSLMPVFRPALVGCFTTEQETLNAVKSRQPTFLMATEDLEVGYGISLVSKVKDISPDTNCLIFLNRNSPEVIEEAIGAGADAVVRIQSLTEGSGDFMRAINALGKGGTYFPEDVRDVIKEDTRGIQKLEMLSELTTKEKEVLTLLCQGLSNREVAEVTVSSVPTIKTHVSNLMTKLHQPSRTALVVLAVKHSLVEFES